MHYFLIFLKYSPFSTHAHLIPLTGGPFFLLQSHSNFLFLFSRWDRWLKKWWWKTSIKNRRQESQQRNGKVGRILDQQKMPYKKHLKKPAPFFLIHVKRTWWWVAIAEVKHPVFCLRTSCLDINRLVLPGICHANPMGRFRAWEGRANDNGNHQPTDTNTHTRHKSRSHTNRMSRDHLISTIVTLFTRHLVPHSLQLKLQWIGRQYRGYHHAP